MIQRNLVAVLAVALVGICTGNVDAGWGSHGSHGSYGSYGSSGGYSYYSGGSSGSSGYSSYYSSSGGSSGYGSYGAHHHVGPIRHLLGKIHNHFHAKRVHRAYYGSSGYASSGYSSYGSGASHGSSGYVSYSYGSSGAYGSSGGASSGHASSGHSSSNYGVMEGYIVPAAPAAGSGEAAGREYQLPGASEAAPAEGDAVAPPAEARIERDAAILTVSVPADAKVYVNDRLTTSEGTIRQYVSRGLMPGYTYTYVVRVEQLIEGSPVVETRSMQLRAGAMERLVFDMPQSDVQVAAQPSTNETALTLEVPEDAVVTLAGKSTKTVGQFRTFRTTQLGAGEVWDDYKVTVTVLRDGREVTKEKVIQLVGGNNERIAFDFDEVTLASR